MLNNLGPNEWAYITLAVAGTITLGYLYFSGRQSTQENEDTLAQMIERSDDAYYAAPDAFAKVAEGGDGGTVYSDPYAEAGKHIAKAKLDAAYGASEDRRIGMSSALAMGYSDPVKKDAKWIGKSGKGKPAGKKLKAQVKRGAKAKPKAKVYKKK